jgi:hypothetical protein
MECSGSSRQRTAQPHLPLSIRQRLARPEPQTRWKPVMQGFRDIIGRALETPHVLESACSAETPHRTGHTGGVHRNGNGVCLDRTGMKTVTRRHRWERLHRPPRRCAPAVGTHRHVRRRCCTDDYSLVNGRTPGSSHFSHISSVFAWKYSMSSSKKWAKRPCRFKYSRTGRRLVRPSTRYLV